MLFEDSGLNFLSFCFGCDMAFEFPNKYPAGSGEFALLPRRLVTPLVNPLRKNLETQLVGRARQFYALTTAG